MLFFGLVLPAFHAGPRRARKMSLTPGRDAIRRSSESPAYPAGNSNRASVCFLMFASSIMASAQAGGPQGS
jgi:hypothetical protein